MGKLEAFTVTLENPANISGHSLLGFVVVVLKEAMKMRKVYVTLVGKAHTEWQEFSGKEKGSYGEEEVYFNERIVLLSSGSDVGELTLAAGSYQYPFSYSLPAGVPSSFEGLNGSVRYIAQATIDIPWKFNHESRTAFTVINSLDLNTEPVQWKEPYSEQLIEDVWCCCCCLSGNVNARLSLSKRCFVPGETVISRAVIVNKSDSIARKLKFSLRQVVEYRDMCITTSNCFNSVSTSKAVAKLVNRTPILPGRTFVWDDIPMVIPPVVPSRLEGCSIINVSYRFELKIFNAVVPVDVVIGTIPLPGAMPSSSVITTQPQSSSYTQFAGLLAEQTQPHIFNTSSLSPPTYEDCVGGQVSISQSGDSKYVYGDLKWAPKYPVYRQLSYNQNQLDQC